VACQVALSCVVLVCAGLASSSMRELGGVDLGYNPRDVLLASFDLEMQRYDGERAAQFQKTLLDEVRAMSGVGSASLGTAAPFDRHLGFHGGIGAEGQPPPDRDDLFLIGMVRAAPQWLESMGMPLLSGRGLSEHDTADTTRVAIINRAVAEKFWPGQDPIGKRLTMDGGTALVEVVGLVGNARYFMLGDHARPMMFVPLAQNPAIDVTLAIRSTVDPLLLAGPLRLVVQRLNPDLPIDGVRTLEEQIARSPLGLMPLRLGVVIAGSQGFLVLLLAIMGLYGLVSFAVANRVREIGIRMALGATRSDILKLITRPSLLLAGVGLLVGMSLAFLVTRPLGGLLYGVSPDNPFVFAGAAVLIAVVVTLANILPARRATRISPVEALRAE
jgi:predicted permease